MRYLPKVLTYPEENMEDSRAHFLKADIQQTKAVLIVWQIPLYLFAFADYQLFSLSVTFWTLICARIFLGCSSLYAVYALTKVRTTRQYDLITLSITSLCVSVLLLIDYFWMFATPPVGTINSLLIFSAYMAFPGKLRFLPPLLFSVGNLVIYWFNGLMTLYLFVYLTISFSLANIFGTIFSIMLQKHRHNEFIARMKETKIKEEMAKLAYLDPLTGVLNRRKLFELAEIELDNANREGYVLSVLMFDIDYFKSFNDKFGHHVGDTLLISFSKFISQSIRDTDIWGRIGGEEFVLVLPGVTKNEAHTIGQRFLTYGITSAQRFTVSIGLTEATAGDKSFSEILMRADKALYLAKQNGRNRVEVA